MVFSFRLPIQLQNTPTPPPKTTSPASSPRSHYHYCHTYPCSQTHRFPSQPRSITKRNTNKWCRREVPPSVSSPPNVALQDEAEGGTSLTEDLPVEEEPVQPELRAELMPKHVAVIMDGNGRWAKMKGLPPSVGHEAGIKSFKRLVRLCNSWGIKVLTVFVFSIDNWVRTKEEVDFLLSLLERALKYEAFRREGIRISVIGDSSKLPEYMQRLISSAEERTKNNSRLQLIMAFSYSGKYDVVQACKSVTKKVKDGLLHLDDINENIIEQELETNCTNFPNPDLLIRTSGEMRVSNFLLWQLAYTELFFNQEFWPDFGKEEFVKVLTSFQQRQRRYGGRHS